MTQFKIGTRGSALALAQAEETRTRLAAVHGMRPSDFEIAVISTAGDRIQNRPLSEVGGKGLFSKEIETSLASGEIDLAVHSTKDMASVLPDGLEISTYLPREEVADAFLSPVAHRIEDLPHGAIVGSSSLRRQALLRRLRPDLDVVMYRGNVQTRLKKLKDGEVAATLLAQAGLKRLGLTKEITALLDEDTFLPAPGQGAICIEIRTDDDRVRALLEPLDHAQTRLALEAERAFLRALDGSCRTPIAGHAKLVDGVLSFKGMILSEDGQQVFETADSCSPDRESATAMGQKAGSLLRQQAGEDFFRHWT